VLFQRPHATSLPCGVQHFGDGRFNALVGIGDHQLDAAQTTSSELAQELSPEGLGLGRSDIHAEHFAAAIAVDPDRNDHRDRDDASALPHLQIGVDPQIGPVAFERTAEEGFHFLIDLLAQPADLAFGDAGHAHRFDHIVERTGSRRHARRPPARPRRAPSRRAGGAPGRSGSSCLCAQLGDAQTHPPGARFP
jgi:hypothetical protein